MRIWPGRDGTLAQRGVAVGDDEIGVDMRLDAEAAAFRAGAERIVEREQPRLDLRDGEAGHRTGEFLREHQTLGATLVVDFGCLPSRGLGLLPPPLRGRVGEGGRYARVRLWLTP